MKGTIGKCVEDLVISKFGKDKWKECLKKANLNEHRIYSTLEDVPDKEIMTLIQAIGQVASMSATQVLEAFGEYWSTVYAPTVYKSYFAKAKSTREFLLSLDQIHVAMTKTIKNAHPPRFTYEWKGDNLLVMHYSSERGLAAMMPGLVRGLGKYFHDSPNVSLSGNDVNIRFA